MDSVDWLLWYWTFSLLGFGCDTATVINVLAHRDAAQRALIQQEYKAMYSEDLTKRLKSELSGKVEVCITSVSLTVIFVCEFNSSVTGWMLLSKALSDFWMLNSYIDYSLDSIKPN